MIDQRKRTGAFGEQIAADYLERHQGFRIVARNWRRQGGELDIVALDQNTLVFVEVRTRSTHSFGAAEESVDWRKQRQVRKMAALFLSEERLSVRQYRFDVVVVELDKGRHVVLDLRHLRNAF